MPTFKNWAETFSCECEDLIRVSSEDEVLKVIQAASKKSLKVRVAGSGHSPSDIVCTSGIILDIGLLNRVLNVFLSYFLIHFDSCLVAAQAGITLNSLNKVLAENGLSMPNLGSISDQTLAGAISTGTHGTGITFGILATLVDSITIITSTLQKKTMSRNSDPDLFTLALCSMGTFGVIVSITIRVEKAFNLEFSQSPISFSHMISNWHSLVVDSQHVRFWWFPGTEDVVLWQANRSEKPVNMPQKSHLFNEIVGVKMYEFSLYMSSFFPSLTNTINQRHFNRFFKAPVSGVGNSVSVFNFDCLFKQYVTEWAIDWFVFLMARNLGPEALLQLKMFIDQSGFPAHAPVEIRFVKGDDIPLSPCFKRDSCYIGIIMYRPYMKDIPRLSYWKEYEKIMKGFGGRPHWAKSFDLSLNGLKELYPRSSFEMFDAARRKLDPLDMFSNEYVKRHLTERTTSKL